MWLHFYILLGFLLLHKVLALAKTDGMVNEMKWWLLQTFDCHFNFDPGTLQYFLTAQYYLVLSNTHL